jgi:hypothetical protein
MTATVQISTKRREMGMVTPRRFSKRAWHRFSREKRRAYLAQIGEPPTNAQASRIETMVRLEWSALRAEHEGTLQADREAREHRRLLDRLLADHERSVASTRAAALGKGVKTRPGPPQLNIDQFDQHLARLRQRQEGAG